MSLDAIFYPQSIAVIGASRQAGSVGHEIAKNLATQGFRGTLYFVNPKNGRLFGHKVLTDLSSIKAPPSLAIIAIPASLVVEEVKQLASLGVKAALVISSGFAETGNKETQDKLSEVCSENNITLIGPNCLGIINPDVKLNASFAPLMPTSGSVAFISQSGALCASVLDYAQRLNIGFSKFVSVGNKAQVGEAELLDYLYQDHKTKVIAIYMEELEEVELLKQIVPRITQGNPHKPIIVLKAGRTGEGQKAALSHTGSLGGSDVAYEAFFAETGMIRAKSTEDLFDIIQCFTRNKAIASDRIAVITNAGGPGVITADALVANGLKLANLGSGTITKLKKFLPKAASVGNPIDILGDAMAERYKQTLEAVLEDANVDAIEIILTPQSTTEVAETAKAIVALKKASKKPLVVTFMGEGLVAPGVDILNKNQVATTFFPELGASALSALNIFRIWQQTKKHKPLHFKNTSPGKVRHILEGNLATKGNLLPIDMTFDILEAYGLPVVQRWTVVSKNQAKDLESKIKGTFALKIISPDINHKTDVGGVVLNVAENKLASEYEKLISHIGKKLPKAKILGVTVMPMIGNDSLELILGAKTDPTLGKQILVGLGGTYTEVLEDVSWGLAPLSQLDIERMIARLKIAKILKGIRSHEPFATDKVVECLGRLSQLVVDFPEIDQVDINPLEVLGKQKGAFIVDARMVISK